MKTEHTPSPWKHVDTRECEFGPMKRYEGIVCVDGPTGSGNCLAIVHLGGKGAISARREDVDANARLISAAPELYEAAMMLEELMADEDFRLQAKDIATDLKAESMIEKFKAALAKARLAPKPACTVEEEKP